MSVDRPRGTEYAGGSEKNFSSAPAYDTFFAFAFIYYYEYLKTEAYLYEQQ